MGRALAPLRDEGVFIVGSGMTFHNLRAFGNPAARPVSEDVRRVAARGGTDEAATRNRKLTAWATAPSARAAHPREEHLVPLMVIAGAAGADHGDDGVLGHHPGPPDLGVSLRVSMLTLHQFESRRSATRSAASFATRSSLSRRARSRSSM